MVGKSSYPNLFCIGNDDGDEPGKLGSGPDGTVRNSNPSLPLLLIPVPYAVLSLQHFGYHGSLRTAHNRPLHLSQVDSDER